MTRSLFLDHHPSFFVHLTRIDLEFLLAYLSQSYGVIARMFFVYKNAMFLSTKMYNDKKYFARLLKSTFVVTGSTYSKFSLRFAPFRFSIFPFSLFSFLTLCPERYIFDFNRLKLVSKTTHSNLIRLFIFPQVKNTCFLTTVTPIPSSLYVDASSLEQHFLLFCVICSTMQPKSGLTKS